MASFGGEGFDALAASDADLDVAGDLVGQVVFADSVLECRAEQGVQVDDGQRGQVTLTTVDW